MIGIIAQQRFRLFVGLKITRTPGKGAHILFIGRKRLGLQIIEDLYTMLHGPQETMLWKERRALIKIRFERTWAP
jgi:hypothetical protein